MEADLYWMWNKKDIFKNGLDEKLEKVSEEELTIVDPKQADPESMAEILSLTNEMPMQRDHVPPPTNNGANSLVADMKRNYKNADEIETDLKNTGIDEYLKHDVQGRFGFYLCEGCAGPMLGHRQEKCRHTESYDSQTVNSFQNWLERMPEFKKQVNQRKMNMENRQAELQAKKFGEVVQHIIRHEGTGAREANTANPTTQLIKPRYPPV